MRVDFYHLQTSPLERALPALLERVVGAGKRAVVMAASDDRIEALNNHLWVYNPNSWLAHGSEKDGFAADQPIYLTVKEENPNGASILVLTDGMSAAFLGSFERCLDMFDGTSEEAVGQARSRWAEAKKAGHELHYWQQTESGSWAEKAT
ncbi:MAG: DNA polymerase III subunit chi [Rhodospirillaceae bacterium]|nr:DNA polymerase III subunit chi [Rhodospirillaceae bacterium]